MMTDVTTQQPLRVSTDGTAGPYIMLPLTQLDDIKRLLDAERIHYWVGELAVSLDGSPYTIDINLGRNGDADVAQAILDRAS